MDYYAEAETIIEKAKEELVQSRIHKKPVWIGLKVKSDTASKQSDSFSGRNKEYVDQIMHEIYVSLNSWFPELQGFSIFDYTGFRSMRK